MAFTFNQYPLLTPEQGSPYAAALSRFLQGAGQGLDLQKKSMLNKMIPQLQQAEIFSKEIGPLASLASNPQFRGFNPEIQKMIAQRIGGYLQGGSGAPIQSTTEAETTGPYPGSQDILSRLLKHSHDVYAPGGAKKLAGSNLAAAAEQWGFPKVAEYLGGSETNAAKAALNQDINDAIQNQILQGVPENIARQRFARGPDESDEAYAKKVAPYLQSQAAQESSENQPLTDADRQDIDFARSLSADIKAKTGQDVDENFIFDYMAKHPGKINVAQLLKAMGKK